MLSINIVVLSDIANGVGLSKKNTAKERRCEEK